MRSDLTPYESAELERTARRRVHGYLTVYLFVVGGIALYWNTQLPQTYSNTALVILTGVVGFFASIGAIVLGGLWLGFFAFRDVPLPSRYRDS